MTDHSPLAADSLPLGGVDRARSDSGLRTRRIWLERARLRRWSRGREIDEVPILELIDPG
jgi:hypothetical protein